MLLRPAARRASQPGDDYPFGHDSDRIGAVVGYSAGEETVSAVRDHRPSAIHLSFASDFLSPKDLLIGVTDGKAAKAYPAPILAQHGVVQDRMADGPIAVTW